MQAEALLKDGDLDGALKDLTAQVKSAPADPKLRVFLFQLLSVRGEWERALNQLNVAAEMDPRNLMMAQMCRAALQCEVLRDRIFTGERTPLVLGEPEEWVGLMIQANERAAAGDAAGAAALRERALESAPAVSGAIDGDAFEWVADADSRLGPILEVIIDGRYYWAPLHRFGRIDIEEPADLRDVVWLPARFTFTNGGDTVGLIPTRYAGSEKSSDGGIRLARKTVWEDRGEGCFAGLGQRLLATDAGEYPIMSVRSVLIGAQPEPQQASMDAGAKTGADEDADG